MLFKNKKVEKEKTEMLTEFSKLVAYILNAVSEDELDYCYKVGKKAHKEFFKKERKPKVSVFEINASSKEEAIKQLKNLELDEDVEKHILKIIENH